MAASTSSIASGSCRAYKSDTGDVPNWLARLAPVPSTGSLAACLTHCRSDTSHNYKYLGVAQLDDVNATVAYVCMGPNDVLLMTAIPPAAQCLQCPTASPLSSYLCGQNVNRTNEAGVVDYGLAMFNLSDPNAASATAASVGTGSVTLTATSTNTGSFFGSSSPATSPIATSTVTATVAPQGDGGSASSTSPVLIPVVASVAAALVLALGAIWVSCFYARRRRAEKAPIDSGADRSSVIKPLDPPAQVEPASLSNEAPTSSTDLEGGFIVSHQQQRKDNGLFDFSGKGSELLAEPSSSMPSSSSSARAALSLSMKPCGDWSVSDVATWVSSLGHRREVVAKFSEQRIDGRALVMLTAEGLTQLGIGTIGERLSILKSIQDLMDAGGIVTPDMPPEYHPHGRN